MYFPPQGPLDKIMCSLVQAQRHPLVGPLIRQLLKARGTDIPPNTLAPGTGLIVRHLGHMVVHVKTKIGRHVMIHQGVTIGRSDIWRQEDPSFSGFVLEDYVILGANAVVTSGRGVLTVGEGTIVGANSVLTTSTGRWEIWAGAPAKKIGTRERPADLD